MHKTWEEANPELSSEFQSLKEKLNEHSKQLEQHAEKLSQLELENLNLRDENQTLQDLYKELTKYQCKTMEDILSRAWAHVKCKEDVANHAKAQQKQDPKTIRKDRTERDKKPSQRQARNSRNQNRGRYQNRPIKKAEGMEVSTWPDISYLSVSTPELINVLRQMGQQVKWPQKMKAPNSFRNPGFWCNFHQDHSHKTEDYVWNRNSHYRFPSNLGN